MGDRRYAPVYQRLQSAEDRLAALRAMTDEEVIAALAAASREHDALLANILATEAQNRTARTQRVLASMGDALLVLSCLEHKILDVNAATERLLGWSADELRGETTRRLHVDEAHAAEFEERMERVLDTGETLQFEFDLRRRDGTPVPSEHTMTLTRNAMGEPVAVVSIARDISERRRAEAALERWEHLFRHAEWGVVVGAPDGETIVSMNDAFARMHGYQVAELVGRPIADVFAPGSRKDLDREVELALTRGHHSFEAIHIRKDGSTFPVHVDVTAVKDRDGRVLYRAANVQDITERKRTERRLAAQNGVAQVLAEARDVENAIDGVLRVFCEVLGWDVGEFWRVDREAQLLRFAQTFHAPGIRATAFREESERKTFAKGESLPGRVWESGGAFAMKDVVSDMRFTRRDSALEAGLHAACGLPVRAGDRTVGVLTFYSKDMRAFDEPLRLSMETIGRQVGQAVERIEAEETARRLLEAAPDATIVSDASGRIEVVNARAEEFFGYRREELVGQPIDILLPGSLRAKHAAHRAGYATAPRARPMGAGLDLRARLRDGREVAVEVSLSPLQTMDGLLIISSIRDVTERRSLEKRLRQLAHIVEQEDDLVLVTDPEGRVEYVNPSFERVTGYSREEVVGQTPRMLRSGEHPPEFYKELWRTILSGRPFRAEFVNRRKDGRIYHEDKTITPLTNGAGKIEHFVSTAKDITSRHLAEERAARMARLFSVLAEAHQEILRAKDLDTLYAAVCRVIVEQGEFRMAWIGTRDDATGRALPKAAAGHIDGYLDEIRIDLRDPELGRGPTGTALRTGEPVVFNDIAHEPRMAPWRDAALRRGYAASAAFPILAGERALGTLNVYAPDVGFFGPEETRALSDLAADIALAVQNIEGREDLQRVNRGLEDRVGERTRLLTQTNAELEQFTSRVSHDLRSPLRGVSFYLEALQEEHASGLDPEGIELLTRARKEGERMRQIIQDFLQFSRSEAGEIVRTRVDLSAIAHEVIDQLAMREPGRHVAVDVQPGLTADADAEMVRIVMENLLGNAWKFTSKTSEARIEVGARKDAAGQTVFYVRDNGAGFPPEQSGRLFQVFQRLHSAKDFEGTGVGLATVARILRRHGGRAWAEGAVGKGATFSFTLAPPPTEAPLVA